MKIGVVSESEEKARTKLDHCWDTQNIHRASTPIHFISQSITSSLSIDTIHRLPPITAHTEKSQERQGISRLLRKNKVARKVFIWSRTAVCAMFGLGLVFLSTGLILWMEMSQDWDMMVTTEQEYSQKSTPIWLEFTICTMTIKFSRLLFYSLCKFYSKMFKIVRKNFRFVKKIKCFQTVFKFALCQVQFLISLLTTTQKWLLRRSVYKGGDDSGWNLWSSLN